MQTSPLLHFSEGNKGNKRCLCLEAIRELAWHSYAVEALYLGSFYSNNDGKENVKKAIGLIIIYYQNNNSARTLHFLVHFFAVSARLGREIS